MKIRLEMSGKNAEDAINLALKRQGLERDDVPAEIIELAKSEFEALRASVSQFRESANVNIDIGINDIDINADMDEDTNVDIDIDMDTDIDFDVVAPVLEKASRDEEEQE